MSKKENILRQILFDAGVDPDDELLFIEPPGDEYGNRGLPCAVISGHLVWNDLLNGFNMVITNPQEIKKSWPTWSIDFLCLVSAKAGPARMIGGGDGLDRSLRLTKLLKETCLTQYKGKIRTLEAWLYFKARDVET